MTCISAIAMDNLDSTLPVASAEKSVEKKAAQKKSLKAYDEVPTHIRD
jgi:hypothetical protein